MTDREKLIELLWSHPCDGKECAFCEHLEPDCDAAAMADKLLASGVTFAKDTNVPSKLISIYDREPENGDLVLAWNKKVGYQIARWHVWGVWEVILPKEAKMSMACSRYFLQHWAPLPKTPLED